jgi:hypothetical protein
MSTTVARFLTLGLAVATVACFSGSATAQDQQLSEVWKDAIGDQEPVLTNEQFAMLNNIAFQAAVTKVCDGFELDQSKFAQAVSDATSPPPSEDMSADDMKTWETAVVMRIGTMYGVFLSVGNAKPADFCASAKELKGDSEVPNVWQ